jgi:Outer membrane protein beta-barrel domain
MRSKLVLAALLTLTTMPVVAQVAPAAKISGLPLGVGAGFTDYDTDYYRPDLPYWSGRMIGISAWADYSIFHGLGVEVEGTSIFANKPTPFGTNITGSLKEQTVQGGIIYRYHPVYKIRPFAKALGGIGKIDFPSTNPFYTSETSGLYSFGGGIEYKAWRTLYLRGQYEYQWWKGFRSGTQSLNPSGFSIGATYYLRGVHRHY